MSRSCIHGLWGLLAVLLAWPPGQARAGLPECGDIRLEDVRSCGLRGSVQCTASCDELGVYKKACATRLQRVCSEECTLSADVTCTDSCTETCTESCDRGENVICIHNCFGECTVNCDATCDGAQDPQQCQASCEANCDAECDISCRPLVDGDCYRHCIECCDGSCTADANMDCQTTCQDREFEDCEYEFRADCMASCSGSGAIFCDGEYVLAGEEIPACVQALAAQGIADIDLEAEIRGSVEDGVASIESAAKAGCNAGGGAGSWLPALLVFGAAAWRRRRAA